MLKTLIKAIQAILVVCGLLSAAVVNAQETAYKINPGDILLISVWKESELQREVVVRPDGGISFPLAGDMPASGHSVQELREELGSRLKKYIPEPFVDVAVKRLNGNTIYVIGKVNRPGAFPMEHRMDVMQALALAGGLNTFASANNIKIIRRDASAKQMVFKFRYSQVADGENLQQNIILKSGDTVVVP